MYIELQPCGPPPAGQNCAAWLIDNRNPYHGVITGAAAATLSVWWRWPHPAGVNAMDNFHGQPLGGIGTPGSQLEAIHNTW